MIDKDPTIKVRILRSFLNARQGQVEQVMEKSTSSSMADPITLKRARENVTTYHQHDAEGNMLVEDIVVESIPNLA